MSEHRAFFGDGEKAFAFPTRDLIMELETKTGHGIGALFRRFRDTNYSFTDVSEILRLGLIGGGTAPQEADRLVSVYAVGRPLAEVFGVADGVITTLFFGKDEEPHDEIRQAAVTGDMSAAINESLKQVAA